MSAWTDDKIQQVRSMWSQGFSARQIGNALKVSRNAVLGIIHRRGFAHEQGIAPASQMVLNEMRVVEPESSMASEHDPIPGTTILSVGFKQCRWPYGDPKKPDFHLCGNVTLADSPYCFAHMRKAYAPAHIRAQRGDAEEELQEIFRRERVFA